MAKTALPGFEHELKLGLPAEAAKAARALNLPGIGTGRPATREYRTVYFDTADRQLGRAGIVYRIRLDGGARIHGVKAPGGAQGGQTGRREWEVKADGMVPDLGLFPPDTVSQAIPDAGIAARLEPLFETRFRRTVRLLTLGDGTQAEYAVDQGSILAGTRTAPLSEIEIELRQGDAARLFDLARQVAEHLPVYTLVSSKGERGLRLADGAAAPVVRARRPALSPDMTAGEALGLVLADVMEQWLGNLDSVREGAAEGVHQMRVALRRLRSAAKLYRRVLSPEVLDLLDVRIGAQARELGAVRDWDVFLASGDFAFPDEAGQRHLRRVAAESGRARGRALEELKARLGGPVHARLVLDIGHLVATRGWNDAGADLAVLDAPVAAFAAEALDRAYRQILKRGRHILHQPPEALHKIRIRVKRLRYALEFFSDLYPRKTLKPALKACSRLQDVLGVLNDQRMAEGLIGSLGRDTADRAFARGLIMGESMARRGAARDELKAVWHSFKDGEAFWRR